MLDHLHPIDLGESAAQTLVKCVQSQFIHDRNLSARTKEGRANLCKRRSAKFTPQDSAADLLKNS